MPTGPALRPACERYESLRGLAVQPCLRQCNATRDPIAEIGSRKKTREAEISLLGSTQNRQRNRFPAAVIEHDREVRADERFDAS